MAVGTTWRLSPVSCRDPRRRRRRVLIGGASLKISPGDRIEIEVRQPDGGRALVVGTLVAVPESVGGQALQIVVCDARIPELPLTPAGSSWITWTSRLSGLDFV
jgi:hypothetical protein